jgi:hypothetical protein
VRSVDVIRPFITYGSSLLRFSDLSTAPEKAGKRRTAILDAHLVKGADDIVFAEDTALGGGGDHVVTIKMLRSYGGVYRCVFVKSYYDEFIFQKDDFVGFQNVSVSPTETALLIITSRGAALGAVPELLMWEDGLGLEDVLPPGVGGNQFSLSSNNGNLRLTVSYETGLHQTDVLRPIVLEWAPTHKKMLEVK